MNENGQRLLEFCTYHNLCITNSYFQTKPRYKVSWRHPQSGHWHYLDQILTQHADLRGILQTCSFHSADCDIDHSLMCCIVKLQTKDIHRAKPTGVPRIDSSKAANPTKAEAFLCALDESLPYLPQSCSAQQYWDGLRDTIYSMALTGFGKKLRRSNDWFEANCSFVATSNQLMTQATSKACMMASKRYLDHHPHTTALLKSPFGETITDRSKQLDRWVEHYSELYASDNTVSEAALCHVERQPAMEELDMEPTTEKLSKALNNLTCGKAPDSNGITAKSKVRPLIIRDMLFADDAAVAAHSQEHLQTLMDRFTQACQDFSLNKTKSMGQGTDNPLSITICNYTLEAVSSFTYLGSTITNNLSLDAELSSRIGKAASTFGKLKARVWDNGKLTAHTKVQVYRACVINTLLYGSEAWTTYSHQEQRINSFHLHCLRHILGITWRDRITHTAVLERAQLAGPCPAVRLQWQQTFRSGLLTYETTLAQHREAKRTKRKQQQQDTTTPSTSLGPAYTCNIYGRVCLSWIGLQQMLR
ncbi:hypothetical protein SKAU_G00094030 [Synaphobranchus kaupii]|uniref:Reverse transcriptase domain-containing protein n=1 Tax=Synaphobranchus kaupii TaxID=118154 RepID=A0A9Q1J4L6_SYNKA|nr:hypothetical protein SKAU_G00094030 [Synaphobranchus kaupii]